VDTNGFDDVFVRDLDAGTTTLASINAAGTASGNGPSSAYFFGALSLSADGRFVSFPSAASDLVADDTNGYSDVFVRDLKAGVTFKADASNVVPSGWHMGSEGGSLSADGRFVVFDAPSPDLVANDNNGTLDVFVRDLVTGTTTLVSANSAGTGTASSISFGSVISADGRYVAFISQASDILPNSSPGRNEVYVRDLQGGTTTRLTGPYYPGNEGPGPLPVLQISADGGMVAFPTNDGTLVPNDSNSQTDIFFAPTRTSYLQFLSPQYAVAEDGGSAVITVTRIGNLAGTATVHYATGAGTALAGTDYTDTSGDLTFNPGDAIQTITVPVLAHVPFDDSETLSLTLSSAVGATLTGPSTTVLTLVGATTNQRLVNGTYLDVLQRPVDTGGMAYWSGQLDLGLPHDALARLLTHSDEYYTDIIRPAYRKFLGRDADANGLAFWVAWPTDSRPAPSARGSPCKPTTSATCYVRQVPPRWPSGWGSSDTARPTRTS
jgi:Tol biopolymer transport system component